MFIKDCTHIILFLLPFLMACSGEDGPSEPNPPPVGEPESKVDSFRVATFNAALNRPAEGQLLAQLQNSSFEQIQKVAQIIQKIRPDILVLQEMDYASDNQAVDLFQQNYLSNSFEGSDTIHYPYRYHVPSNTGLLSDVDIDGSGNIGLPGDAFGFGNFEGQYAFAVFSKYKLAVSGLKSFMKLLWKDMPDARLPKNIDGSNYYSEEVMEVFRLSSKNHIDLPVITPANHVIHLLVAHPTPPVFDGQEDRNGLRNADEIRLLADYINAADYLVSDAGNSGALTSDDHFIVLGDLNADPVDGDSVEGAMAQLFEHPRINKEVTSGNKIPASRGGEENDPGPNRADDEGFSGHDTASWGLRVDYVLPSASLEVIDSGVFWPAAGEEGHELVAGNASSDHRMVWVDLVVREQ